MLDNKRLNEASAILSHLEIPEALSYFSFPLIHWHEMNKDVVRMCAQYAELLTALRGFNTFQQIASNIMSGTEGRSIISTIGDDNELIAYRGNMAQLGNKQGVFSGGVDESIVPITIVLTPKVYVIKQAGSVAAERQLQGETQTTGVTTTHQAQVKNQPEVTDTNRSQQSGQHPSRTSGTTVHGASRSTSTSRGGGTSSQTSRGVSPSETFRKSVQDQIFVEDKTILMTIGATLSPMQFNFDDLLSRDANLSNRNTYSAIKAILSRVITFFRQRMNARVLQWTKRFRMLDKSVESEVFGKNLIDPVEGKNTLLTTYVLLDATRLPEEVILTLTDPDKLLNLSKMGWSNFIIYFPNSEQCVFVTKTPNFMGYIFDRMRQDAETGEMTEVPNPFGFTKELYDIRFVNLGILKNFHGMLQKGHSFTQEDLSKLNKSIPTIGNKGFSVIRGLFKS